MAYVADAVILDTEHIIDEVPLCAVCAHPSAAHDPIAERYCQASASSSLSRHCVCKVVAPSSTS
jgi:hypothetical protein